MPIGDVGHWRDSAGSQFAAANTFGGFNFASQQRNDNSTYSKPDGSTIEIEEAGDYLIIGHLVGTDGDTGRHGPQARLNLVTGSGDLFSMYSSGFNRNANNNDWSCCIFGIYRNGAANDQIEIEWRRDTDAAGGPGGSTANASDVQIVRLGDSWNYGFYESTSAGNAFGGTTPNDVAFATTVHETDTAVIEKQAGNTDIRLKSDNTRFLIAYGVAGDTGGSRTQRLSRLVSGSTEIDASRSYFYQRNAANEYGGLGAVVLHETVTADEDISVQVYRGDGVTANQGGADVDGSWTNNSGVETACVVVELPDHVEVFAAVDGTAGQDIAGGVTSTINSMRTVNFNDSASFTAPAIDTMDVVVAMDALVWANIVTARATVSLNVRLLAGARIEIDGVDQTTGVHKCYTRGNQGTQDTFGGSWHPGAIFTFTAGQDVQFETFDDGDNGGDDTTRANEVGAFAINLDTLEAGGTEINATADSLTITEQSAGINAANDIQAAAASLAITEFQASINAATNIAAGTDSLAISEQEASINAATDIQAVSDSLTITELPATIGLSTDISAGIDSLVLTAQQAGINAETAIQAGTDALSLTEFSASIQRNIDAGADALTITEFQATVGLGLNISASADSLTLTEFGASINAETEVQAGADSLTLSELPATVSRNIDASLDTLTLTEFPAAINAATEIAAGLDTLTITEQAANVSAGSTIAAGTDSLTISEQQASINAATDIPATSDSLTITEFQASVSAGNNISATADSLVLTAFAASVNAETEVQASADALNITEQVASIELSTIIQAAADSLTITEFQASVSAGSGINASADSLTLSELAASVSLDVDIAATLDTLSITEQQASIGLTSDILAGLDTLTLTEFAATITKPILAGFDALAITTFAASVTAGSANPFIYGRFNIRKQGHANFTIREGGSIMKLKSQVNRFELRQGSGQA